MKNLQSVQGHQKVDVYFDAPANGTPEHQDNYYRIDYSPVTILTLDSSNGEPDDSRDNYGGEGVGPHLTVILNFARFNSV